MTISLNFYLLLPMLTGLIFVAAAGIFYGARSSRQYSQAGRKKSVYQCTACHKLYITQHDVPMAPCPRCGEMNDMIKH